MSHRIGRGRSVCHNKNTRVLLFVFLVGCCAALLWSQSAGTNSSFYFPRIAASQSADAGVAIFNPTSTDASVSLALSGADGQAIGAPVTIAVPPLGQVARTTGQIFGATVNGDAALQVSSATAGLVAYYQTFDARGTFMDGTTAPDTALDLIFPVMPQTAADRARIDLVNRQTRNTVAQAEPLEDRRDPPWGNVGPIVEIDAIERDAQKPVSLGDGLFRRVSPYRDLPLRKHFSRAPAHHRDQHTRRAIPVARRGRRGVAQRAPADPGIQCGRDPLFPGGLTVLFHPLDRQRRVGGRRRHRDCRWQRRLLPGNPEDFGSGARRHPPGTGEFLSLAHGRSIRMAARPGFGQGNGESPLRPQRRGGRLRRSDAEDAPVPVRVSPGGAGFGLFH